MLSSMRIAYLSGNFGILQRVPRQQFLMVWKISNQFDNLHIFHELSSFCEMWDECEGYITLQQLIGMIAIGLDL